MTQNEMLKVLEDTVGVVKTSLYVDNKDHEITDITYNSKQCKPGCAFFAKGEKFKEEYILDAENNGATLVISQAEYNTRNAGIIVVKDIRKAMVVVAESFFGEAYKNLVMIGLTGTKGKTTTATYIHNVLNEYCKEKTGLLSTIQTYTKIRDEESHLSTPEAIELQRYIKECSDSDLKYVTMEVSSQSYKTQRILNMPFNIGLFLNISEDHISPSEHPNFLDYLNSKLEFVKNCNIVIINGETDYYESVKEAAKNAKKTIIFSKYKNNKEAEYYYTNVQNEERYITFDVMHNGEKRSFRTQMLGEFNVENALAAIIVSDVCNIPYEDIKKGIEKTVVSGRMNVFKKDKKTVIVDYAHNKISFEKFFDSVSKNFKESNIYAVFGAPGGKAYGRRKDMAQIASKYCKKIILTADDPQYEEALDICNELATFVTCGYEIIEDRKQAIEKTFEKMEDGSVLCLLAKGEDRYQQVKGKFEPYESDLDIAKRLCK